MAGSVMITDRTNHNLLSEQLSARLASETPVNPAFVDYRLRELEAFETRARGSSSATHLNPHKHINKGDRKMSLLQPAVSSSAFLKSGILGFQGGGKTVTSAEILIGLYLHTLDLGLHDGTKPVAMFDTEKGSDWLIPMFKKAGVPFVVTKRQAFADLLKVIDEAEATAFGLLIDSVTHPWRELVESYLRKKERSYLAMDDWGYLKGEHGWKQFTDRFVNSKLHIVMAGRAGYEYENYVEDGRKKMEKVGTKMKTEGETGYEPDLLILMEQVEDLRTGKVVHRATVQKDRSQLLDGKQFDNPTFKEFLPHIQCLALGAAHVGVAMSGDSQHLLKTEKRDWQPVQRRIVIDETKDLLTLFYPGQTAQDKTGKLRAMIAAFNASWAEIEEVMSLPDLRAGYDNLHRSLEGKPSKYASAIEADNRSNDLNDALPDHSAPVTTLAQATDAALVNAFVQPSPELLASRIVAEAPVEQPSEFDEAKWLADLTRAFNDCIDFVSFGEQRQSIMLPAKPKVTETTWAKAMKLAKKATERLLSQPEGFAVAAE